MRLVADNVTAALVPGLMFTAAACAHHAVTGPALAGKLALSALYFAFYQYVFDAANQACGAEEDRGNKPWRPIPHGMITPARLMRRFWFAMALYPLLGAATGTLPRVLGWQATTMVLTVLGRPRLYVAVKPATMLVATAAQLGAAWSLAAPLDQTGWRWILVITLGFVPALGYEDVRDMEGDRRVGRVTMPLLVGAWPVRIWFATITFALPAVLHLLLYAPSGAGTLRIAACDVIMAGLCWLSGGRALLMRTTAADRVTYQIFVLAYCASLATAIVLL